MHTNGKLMEELHRDYQQGCSMRREVDRRAGYADFFCAVTYSRSAALMRLW